jgi:hypothetical protein
MKNQKKAKKKTKSTAPKSETQTFSDSTILDKYYTPQGEHPEDRTYRDKEYIKRLHEHIDEVYEKLAKDLRFNEKGREWLFDYLYNEDDNIELEEYLLRRNIQYKEVVK